MLSDHPNSHPPVSELRLYLFSLAAAAAVANGYYIHPLLTLVRAEFGVPDAMLGLIPAINQMAIAMGILFLLPLGDKVDNRLLVIGCVACQFVAALTMALAPSFAILAVASGLLGFATITPYLLPAYAASRVEAGRLGHVTGIMASGVALGILAARAGGGVLGHYLGWRSAYFTGASLMLLFLFLLPFLMERDDRSAHRQAVKGPELGYWALLRSLGPIALDNRHVVVAAVMQGMSFSVFLTLWLGLGLYLPSPQMGYSVDTVGYLALLAIANVFLTPRIGRFVDRIAPLRARLRFAIIQLVATFCLFWASGSLWLLIVPIMAISLFGASIDICNRTLLFQHNQALRTRMMTIYVVVMFACGGAGSWLATSVWTIAGWAGISGLCSLLSCGIVSLAFLTRHWPIGMGWRQPVTSP